MSRQQLVDMTKMLQHRGPDDSGYWLCPPVALGFRRLSIVDLSGGHQPMSNEDETIWIVFNGEIYNHALLRPDLERRGHRYSTRSDTETIIHLYEEYGVDCVQHLCGMFAFAIWDSCKQQLFCARDRLGIKPFYYWYPGDTFLFSSEIKSILVCPGVSTELNRKVLPEFLAFGYLAGTQTMFSSIKKLAPGHTLLLDRTGHCSINQYWDIQQASRTPYEQGHSDRYYSERYAELLRKSVRTHLMSDVPVGVFLSGGIDSSAIAALMNEVRCDPIQTFAVGYSEDTYSELPYARVVANHLGTIHHEVQISSRDFFEALPKLIWHEDEPLVWPSSVPLYFCARLAGQNVKVVLSGEGSDETLAGYTRYPWTCWNTRLDKVYRNFVPSSIRRSIRDFVNDSDWFGVSSRNKLCHTSLGRDGSSWASFYFDNFYTAFSEAEQTYLLSDELLPPPGTAYMNSLFFWEKSSGALLDRLLFTDVKTYLVELCMKQDQMSMAASIESRVPFLDHELVEFALSIPAAFKVRGLSGKRILKAAVKDLLPESILNRRKKGFPTPLSDWLHGSQLDAVQHILLERRSLNRDLFKSENVRKILAEHRARYRNHSDKLWRLLNLEVWHRIFIDRDPAIVLTNSAA